MSQIETISVDFLDKLFLPIVVSISFRFVKFVGASWLFLSYNFFIESLFKIFWDSYGSSHFSI